MACSASGELIWRKPVPSGKSYVTDANNKRV